MDDHLEAAVATAAEALHLGRCGCDGGDGIICRAWHRRHATTALEAAEPLIRAAERERIRQLAEKVGAYYDETATCTRNCTRAPHEYVSRSCVPFADLLGEGP